jgi:hypothetical protein
VLDSIGFSATTTTRWPRWKSCRPRKPFNPYKGPSAGLTQRGFCLCFLPPHTRTGAAPTLPPLWHPGSRHSAPLLSGVWHLRLTSDGTCAIIIYGTRSRIWLGTWTCESFGTWQWHLACRISSVLNPHSARSDIHV